MKLTQEALNKVFDGITFEAHERVPFFVVDKDSYLDMTESIDEDGETIQVQVPIIGNYYTEELDGVTYAKMNSTHKNADGTFSGAEPTYSSEQPALEEWQEAFGDAISAEDMMEIRKVASMTETERIAYEVEKLRVEKNDVAFELVVQSAAKGELKDYTVNLKIYSELQTQFASGGNIAFHDNSLTLHEVYTQEEAYNLLMDIGKAVAYREAKYDIWITRAAQGIFDTSEVFTEQEQAYIDSIVGGIGAS